MQRTPAEAEALKAIGDRWWRQVWGGSEAEARNQARTEIIEGFRKEYGDHGLRLSRGFQEYDPVIRVDNKAHTYAALLMTIKNSKDVGDYVESLDEFFHGDIELKDLSSDLKALVVIACVAEVGRGFKASLGGLMEWINSLTTDDEEDLEEALDVEHFAEAFPPSIKYKDDQKDWVPPKDEPEDSDEDVDMEIGSEEDEPEASSSSSGVRRSERLKKKGK